MDPTLIPFQDALAGEYSIERELGRGGMGVVYLAREVQLNRLVAIKVLPQTHAAQPGVRDRFLKEARTAAGLSHPNIVPIHRVGEAADLPYFVMTYVEGGTLGERLRDRGPMQSAAITRVLRDVGQALAYAHLRGIVHRDIKPDNILLEHESGRALVTDFGIASVADDATTDGPVAGTAQFMSPEQLMDTAVDGRSDVYSLGIVAYLAVSGVLPHDDADVGTMMRRRIVEDAVPVETLARDVPAILRGAIMRCVERDPARRFATAEALVTAMESPQAVARPILPPALRTWASQTVPLLPVYGFWSIGMLASSAINISSGRWIWGTLSLIATSAPMIPIMVFQLRKTQRALRAGYTLADLRLALRTWRADRLEELVLETSTREPFWARALRALAPTAFATSFIAGIIVYSFFGVLAVREPSTLMIALLIANQIGSAVGMGSVMALTALGAPILPPSLQRRWLGHARTWLWNSPVGEWFAKRIAPRDRALAAGDFRPTEMALSIALDGLFASLPEEYRANLLELPSTVARLSAHATELREEADRLSSQMELGDQLDQTAVALRVRDTQTRMAEAVAALERIRLGLLRLHGGVSDLRPLTTALDAAREIGRDVDRLTEAQSEVSGRTRMLGFDARTPTPA